MIQCYLRWSLTLLELVLTRGERVATRRTWGAGVGAWTRATGDEGRLLRIAFIADGFVVIGIGIDAVCGPRPG